MPIKTTCNCGFTFNAKDQLAGKKVKCPRCTKALQIPSAKQAVAAGAKANPGSRSVNKALLDLLDEEGVESVPQGPICQSCGNVMSASSVICVNCGFNTATGEFLETEIEGEAGFESVGVTNADRIMARAEEEIDENPITAEGQDFGDGADSYVIALVAMAVFGVLLLAGLAVVLSIEYLTADVNPGAIAGVLGMVIYVACHIWLTVLAFMDDIGKGVLCFFFWPFACYYGFTKGGAFFLLPAAILPICLLIGCAGIVYAGMAGAA